MVGLGTGVGLNVVTRRPASSPLVYLGSALLAAFDAERADTLMLSGNLIDAWRDLVSGQAPSQSVGGSKPALSATGFNGRPEAAFDGGDDYLSLVGVANLPTGAAPCEIWALVRCTGDPASTSARNVIAWGNDTNTSRRLRRTVSGGVNRAQAVVGTSGAPSIPANLSVDFTGIRLVRLIIDGSTVGVQVDENLANPVAAIPMTGNAFLRIGSQEGSGPGGYWQGGINSIWVIDPTKPEWTTENRARFFAEMNVRRSIA